MDSFNSKSGVSARVYQGDAMSLLAFDLDEPLVRPDFVGFSIKCKPPRGSSYFLLNLLNFDGKSDVLAPSDKAPFQKFRWLHVPGNIHQRLNDTAYGDYTYTITPRYWDLEKLAPLEESTSVEVGIAVKPFEDNRLEIAFCRGFMTSQAYTRRFGKNGSLRPDNGDLLFDVTQVSGTAPDGEKYTYEDQYLWMGFTARAKTLALIQEVLDDPSMTIDVFAYDFNEPEIAAMILELASKGRVRMILDNATLHTKPGKGETITAEDRFDQLFSDRKQAPSELFRGKFKRYAHDKVIIVKKNNKPVKVLTGSTNFSISGFCVNANHVIIINNPKVAKLYEDIFEASWGAEEMTSFPKSTLAGKVHKLTSGGLPSLKISFAPHPETIAADILDSVAKRITGKKGAKSSVLFSVMSLDRKTGGPVYPALRDIQNKEDIFSYGVTDQTDAVALYKPGSRRGILVNAKQMAKSLPEPFKTEVSTSFHNIHHKFVVIDFNTDNATVFCGSSNLALGGEKSNGDNLLAIQDKEIATVFAIEALRLVDHYHFRANSAESKTKRQPLKLSKNSKWAAEYYDEDDIHYLDRKLFCKTPKET
jgi:phosphatidylserine/phosphatidylglycerophosphate/cardiolipin synthase-like enzyme